MFADQVVLQAAVAPPTDRAELAVAGVDSLVAAQVGGLCEALPACRAAVRPDLLMHQLVARQVAGMVETLPTDIADEGLLEVGHPVRLEHADTGVALPTDIAVATFLPSVPGFDVQVTVSFVVEPLGAEVAGVRQQPVLFALMFTELQNASEQAPANRAHQMGFTLVVAEPL